MYYFLSNIALQKTNYIVFVLISNILIYKSNYMTMLKIGPHCEHLN